MLARVAIDLGLDRLFDYSVPAGLEKKLAVGQLLFVPFGRRTARGFVIEILPDPPAGAETAYDLKPVAAIADETPFFSSAMLALAKKIAAYTAAPLESVLKSAVPASVAKQVSHDKTLFFVEPVPEAPRTALPKRQQWLYEQIKRLGGGWMAQLCRELETSPATVKALADKGFVSIAPRRKRRDPLAGRKILPSSPLKLNDSQAKALETIVSAPQTPFRPVLLHGVTGSGKTEVYLQAIAAELERGRGAIVLVPEIALTPQTVQRFASRFGDTVAVLHSALSDGERHDEWHRIRSGEARVVVGPRSAVFAPVRNLGLIVVDEEHEPGYKQDESPRYNARDVAVVRGSIEGAKVVLGSATPSLESWMNAKRGKYALASIPERAGKGTLPGVAIVDMSAPENRGRIFSAQLLDAIRGRLERAEQTILFLNRRGFSRALACPSCGYTATCDACGVPFTYHKADDCLRCHICGRWAPAPSVCPECGVSLKHKGFGTQKAEATLSSIFKGARILRMDLDSTSRKFSHDDILGAFRRHEADILVGTQMIAKGLDFPNVTLVGVLNADSSLYIPDFRAAERTFQLLSQVCGRAGRAELPGEAYIQTYDPDSSVIRAASRGDYASFAEEELAERKAAHFPPYCHYSSLNLRSKDPGLVSGWADMYAKSLAKIDGLTVGEAVPGFLEKADGWYRWCVSVRCAKPSLLINAWKWLSKVRRPPAALKAALDVDAFSPP